MKNNKASDAIIAQIKESIHTSRETYRERLLKKSKEDILREAWEINFLEEIECCFDRYKKIALEFKDDLELLIEEGEVAETLISYYNGAFIVREIEQSTYCYQSRDGFCEFLEGLSDEIERDLDDDDD